MKKAPEKSTLTTSPIELERYIERSNKLKLKPRCPIAHAELCPRYYTSMFLLSSVGVTPPISEEVNARLHKKWQDFQPTVGEEDASIHAFPGKKLSGVSNFCPEVSYEVFDQFVSSFLEYPDELDREAAHKRLSRESVSRADPRWHWFDHSGRHYSECREFSLFSEMTGGKSKNARSRSGVPDSVRWQVFARDGYICQYCGRRPPEVILEADHRTSAINQGSGTLENLVTSCRACNRGKGARNG